MRASVVLGLLFSILSQVIGLWNVRKDLFCVECMGRKTLTQSVIVLGEHINPLGYAPGFVSDIAIFVLKRDVKLQLTPLVYTRGLLRL